jgi:uncharacterized membrane protein YccC
MSSHADETMARSSYMDEAAEPSTSPYALLIQAEVERVLALQKEQLEALKEKLLAEGVKEREALQKKHEAAIEQLKGEHEEALDALRTELKNAQQQVSVTGRCVRAAHFDHHACGLMSRCPNVLPPPVDRAPYLLSTTRMTQSTLMAGACLACRSC